MLSNVILESALAGLATVLGAALTCFLGKPKPLSLSVMLGFAGGVMGAVTLFDLLPFAYACGSLLYVCAGFAAGVCLMKLAGRITRITGQASKSARSSVSPPSNISTDISSNISTGNISTGPSPGLSTEVWDEPPVLDASHYLKMGRLIAIGIALHDLPEGMSIAAGWSAQAPLGLVTALAIGLHNIPEGVAAATPLLMGGKKHSQILLYCLWISLFTPLGAALGLSLSQTGNAAMSVLLSLAGGSMAYLSLEELIPESLRTHRFGGSLGFVSGFVLTGRLIFALSG
jgi:ZIP family zinc transporter